LLGGVIAFLLGAARILRAFSGTLHSKQLPGVPLGPHLRLLHLLRQRPQAEITKPTWGIILGPPPEVVPQWRTRHGWTGRSIRRQGEGV
jgi:hypothetical protein